MKHLLASILLTLAVLTAPLAHAGSVLLLGVGGGGAPPASYTGPGDVLTGWYAYWGSRAFSSATRGNRLWNVCNSTGGVTDISCADILSDAVTGNAVPQTIGGLSCPAANCTIKIYYDLSGQTNCTGGIACDALEATISKRATWTANAIGTNSCGTTSGTADSYIATLSGTLAQPYSLTAIVAYSSVAANELYFGGAGGGGTGAGVVPTTFALYANTVITGAAADTSPHAIQSIFNGASSFMTVDTTTSATANAGSIGVSGGMHLFEDSFTQSMVGTICEVGLRSGAFSGPNISALYANQHTWGGF